jgi:hypothetical protein
MAAEEHRLRAGTDAYLPHRWRHYAALERPRKTLTPTPICTTPSRDLDDARSRSIDPAITLNQEEITSAQLAPRHGKQRVNLTASETVEQPDARSG